MLEELRTVVPPPPRPYFADGDWAAVESAIGTPLPGDYKEFIRTYGAGWIKGLVIQSPFVWVADGREVRRAWADWASMYEDYAEYGGVEVPYPVFPEPGGLLPFGTLGDVDSLNWRMVGEPDAWPFVYYDRDAGFTEVDGLSAVGFVLEAVTRRSPVLIRTRSDAGFEPPLEFKPFTGL